MHALVGAHNIILSFRLHTRSTFNCFLMKIFSTIYSDDIECDKSVCNDLFICVFCMHGNRYDIVNVSRERHAMCVAFRESVAVFTLAAPRASCLHAACCLHALSWWALSLLHSKGCGFPSELSFATVTADLS